MATTRRVRYVVVEIDNDAIDPTVALTGEGSDDRGLYRVYGETFIRRTQ